MSSIRSRVGAGLESRLQLLAPARRLRFALTIDSIERFSGGRRLCILDAGCGDGLLSEALARRHPDWRIVGADTRDDLLERARARVIGANIANIEFVHADLTEDLGEAAYDAVAAIECLVEIPDDEQALRMMAKTLKPGGMLVAHVPEQSWEPVLPGSERTWRDEVRHGYLAERLVDQLAGAGLANVRVKGTCRGLVRFAQEVRDHIKSAPVWLRALAFPLMVTAVRLERHGITWGRERALFALARRAPT
jgi:ubiquinone/menaquinone biosynthesis C-methylase UbiE